MEILAKKEYYLRSWKATFNTVLDETGLLKFIHNQFNFTINRKRLFYDTTLVVLIACTHQEICNKNMHTVLCKSYANTILPLFVSWQLKVNFASGTSVKCQKHFCKILLSYQDKQSEISAKISAKICDNNEKNMGKIYLHYFCTALFHKNEKLKAIRKRKQNNYASQSNFSGNILWRLSPSCSTVFSKNCVWLYALQWTFLTFKIIFPCSYLPHI